MFQTLRQRTHPEPILNKQNMLLQKDREFETDKESDEDFMPPLEATDVEELA